MSRDIKDLIDSIEEENITRAELERTIDYLKEEVKRLNFTIKEQKMLIQEQEKAKSKSVDLPSDVQILKDIVFSNRQELSKRDKDIEILEKKIDELEKQQRRGIEAKDNEELINAKKLIVQLTKKNENSQENIEKLKAQIQELKAKAPQDNYSLELALAHKINQRFKVEIEELEKYISTLEEELEKAEIKSEVPIETKNSEELELAHKKIEVLISENEDLQAQVNFLQQEVNKAKLSSEQSVITIDQLDEIPGTASISENDINARNLVKKLTEENEMYRINVKTLKIQLQDMQGKILYLQQELENTKSSSEEPISNIEKIEEINKKLLEIEEENTKLKRNLATNNTTINNLVNEIDSYLKEISDQNEEIRIKNIKISTLNSKIEGLEELNVELKESKLKPTIEVDIGSSDRIKNLEEENQKLIDKVLELNLKLQETNLEPLKETGQKIYAQQNLPKSYKTNLFMKMLDFLGSGTKETVVDSLIQDLNSGNIDIMRFAINILSEIKGEKAYNALKNMIHNENWLVRYSLLNALSKFDNEDVKELLKEFLNDADVDVRETAEKILKRNP